MKSAKKTDDAHLYTCHFAITCHQRFVRAYDGDRAPHSGSWGDGDAKSWNYGLPWKIGDVVGFACDLDLEASSKTITFYLNGKSMGVAFANVDYVCGLTPAMTVQVRHTVGVAGALSLPYLAPSFFVLACCVVVSRCVLLSYLKR